MTIIDLSRNIIKRYVEVVAPEKITSDSETAYGTVVSVGEELHVMIDGSSVSTPASSNIDLKDGDRVLVLIKNHEAIVIGSPSSPTARLEELKKLGGKVSEFETVIADKVGASELDAIRASIGDLTVSDANITERLTASEGKIEKLTAYKADIEKLKVEKIDADDVEANYARIGELKAANAEIDALKVGKIDASTVESTYAKIKDLDAKYATVENLEATNAEFNSLNTKYANIDFANINEAAVKKIFSDSGIIRDLVVSDSKITGELVGVTIKGDIIEGGTVKADKLVVKGEDGLYYKLNVNSLGETTAASDPKYQEGLDGSVIIAKSITAERVAVDDLVAFGATIGGFHITDSAIYSGVKNSATNTTRGSYIDKDGQVSVGDADNFIRYYKDVSGNYKLEISASSLSIRVGGKSSNVETAINDVKSDVDSLRDEISTLLRIESSRGTVFKNDMVDTVLSVVIYHGSKRITDSVEMKSTFGSGAYLQWKWQRLDDDSFGIISSSDSRFGNEGFTFRLSPKDVDTKITFMCELII